MAELLIPCIIDPNKSCLKIGMEIPSTNAPDAENVAELTKGYGLTIPQARFCVDCSKALLGLAEVKST